jgi:hypothetical protein
MTFEVRRVLDLLVGALEVRVLLVHQADHEQHRIIRVHRGREHLFRADFNPRRCRNEAQGAVRRAETGDRITVEVQVSRRVDQVDLYTLPLGERARNVDGVAAFDLFGSVVGESGSVLDASPSLTGGGHEGQRIDESCLTAGPVSHYSHISDFSCFVLLHNRDPR